MNQLFFYCILSEYCLAIEHLIIKNKNQLNFDFLLKFEDIQILEIKQQLLAELISRLFEKFQLLKSLSFY